MSSGKRIAVWVVDDVKSVRQSIAAVLETADMAVSDYGSAAEFLAAFTPGTRGCLIVDHHMPEMTGLQLLQQLQASGATPPAIVITGQGDPQLKARLLAAGAATVLNKPVDAADLIALIEQLTLNGA